MAVEIFLYPINNRLQENGYDVGEEESIYERTLQDVLENPRWYLDHLSMLVEYRVSWKDYRDPTPTLPLKHVVKSDGRGKGNARNRKGL